MKAGFLKRFLGIVVALVLSTGSLSPVYGSSKTTETSIVQEVSANTEGTEQEIIIEQEKTDNTAKSSDNDAQDDKSQGNSSKPTETKSKETKSITENKKEQIVGSSKTTEKKDEQTKETTVGTKADESVSDQAAKSTSSDTSQPESTPTESSTDDSSGEGQQSDISTDTSNDTSEDDSSVAESPKDESTDSSKPESSEDESTDSSKPESSEDESTDSSKPESPKDESADSSKTESPKDESTDSSKTESLTPTVSPKPTESQNPTDAPKSDTEKEETSSTQTVPSSTYSNVHLPASTYHRPLGMVTMQDRLDMVEFALQYVTEKSGLPYVWGGESLETGVDCSGFMMQIYAHFGMTIPRTSAEQAEASQRINIEDAKPGDLVFKARNGAVYHVMMVVENHPEKKELTVVEARGANWGLLKADFSYDAIYCAGSFLADKEITSTQASDYVETGKKAANGDEDAQKTIIRVLADAVKPEWSSYGMTPSAVIAKIIEDTNWLSFEDTENVSAQENCVLIPYQTETEEDDEIKEELNAVSQEFGKDIRSMLSGMAESYEQHTLQDTLVRHSVSYKDTEEDTKYKDMETCISDFAKNFIAEHETLKDSEDTEATLQAVTDDKDVLMELVETHDLTKYDTMNKIDTYRSDSANYTTEELELIWAIVAQEDDTSYEGALAVISSAMNRADVNYGGYGTTALEQLTAEGQYCYSPQVSDPSLYQRRLGGNVPVFVQEAVQDCVEDGIRNTTCKSFRSTYAEGREQIGSNWFFN